VIPIDPCHARQFISNGCLPLRPMSSLSRVFSFSFSIPYYTLNNKSHFSRVPSSAPQLLAQFEAILYLSAGVHRIGPGQGQSVQLDLPQPVSYSIEHARKLRWPSSVNLFSS
jgi:hypothetical protein